MDLKIEEAVGTRCKFLSNDVTKLKQVYKAFSILKEIIPKEVSPA